MIDLDLPLAQSLNLETEIIKESHQEDQDHRLRYITKLF
jgi:hypothetical protein